MSDSPASINNPRILPWFTLQFACGVGGAVASTASFGLGVLAAIIAALACGITLGLGWSARSQKDALKPLADGLAVLGVCVFLYLIFNRELIIALGTLLICAQMAINLMLREHRQLYLGLVIAFALVMVGAAEAVSGSYLWVFIVYGLSTSFCLAEIWLDKNNGVIQSLKAPPMTQRLKVAVTISLLTLAIYALMPRLPAGNLGSQRSHSPDYYTNEQWEQEAANSNSNSQQHRDGAREHEEPSEKTPTNDRNALSHQASAIGDSSDFPYQGFADQFNIQQAGERSQSQGDGIVAYMKAPYGSYLKVRTFDTFDGARWSMSSNHYQKRSVDRGKVILDHELSANFRQVIHIKQTMPAWIPVAPQALTLWLPSTVIALDTWQQPMLPGPLRKDTRYTVDSQVTFHDRRLITGHMRPTDADLQLPTTLDARIPALAKHITQNADEPLHRAVALEHHLRTEYEYSFQSIFDSQGFTPLDEFLFTHKKGHCEYFASAMAVMLRSIDIPARLVTGFSATQKNPMTGYYEIRALDGHAWVEAWFEDIGWLTFEPTAFYQMPRPEHQVLSAQQITEYIENLRRAEEVTGDGGLSLTNVFSTLWLTLYHGMVIVLSYIKLLVITLWPLIIGIGILFIAAFLTRDRWLPWVLMQHSGWKIRQYTPKDVKAALPFYLFHLQRVGDFYGVPRNPAQSIEAWTNAMSKRFANETVFQQLEDVVNHMVYGASNAGNAPLQKTALAVLSILQESQQNKKARPTSTKKKDQ